MVENNGGGSHRFFKWVLGGCAAAILFGVAVTVLIVLNIETLVPEEIRQGVTKYVSSRKAALDHMGELNILLSEEVEAEWVQTAVSFVPGEGNDHLLVEVMNPVLSDNSDTGRERTAREIAEFAAENYGGIENIETVAVFFISQMKAGITLTHSEPFDFPVKELLQRTADRNDENT